MFTIFLVTIFYSSLSFSQIDSGNLYNQQKDLEKYNSRIQNIPEKIIDFPNSKIRLPLESNHQVYVDSFTFSGDIKFISKSQLSSLISSYAKKDLLFEDLLDVVDIISKFYKDNGFVISDVYIPEQEVSDYVIDIYINEGKLDSKNPLEISKPPPRLSLELPNKYFDDFITTRPDMSNLEKGIYLLNDLPGVSAKASLKSGQDIGSSMLVLDIDETPLFNSSYTVDNYGSRYTGSNRLSYNLDVNNPSGSGDHVNVALTKSNDSFLLKRVSYDIPLLDNGLRTKWSYAEIEYTIGKELATNPATKGNAKVSNISVSLPIKKSSKESIVVSGDLEFKRLVNEASGSTTSDKDIANFSTSVLYEKQGNLITNFFSKAKLTHTFGDIDLSKNASSLSSDQSSSGAKTNGSFHKTLLEYDHFQIVNELLNIHAIAVLQTANKNLDTSEKLSLGGINGVRSYPSGEASGDQGFKFSLDLDHQIEQTDYGSLSSKIFFDYGKIKQYKDVLGMTLTTPNIYSLKGWGLGASLDKQDDYSISINWASSIGSNPGRTSSGNNSDGLSDSSRLWVQATWKV